MPRRVSTGFELANIGYGTGTFSDISSEAARTGQLGYAYRKASARAAVFHVDGYYGSGGVSEQGYSWGWSVWIRVRTFGSGEDQIAAVQGLGNNPSTCVITLNGTTGTLAIYSVGGAGWAGRTIVAGSTALAPGNWYLFTWSYRHADPGCEGSLSPCLPPACEGSYDFYLFDATMTGVWSTGLGTFGLPLDGMGNDFGSAGVPRNLGYTAVVLGHEGLVGAPAQSGLELDFEDLLIESFTTLAGYVSCQTPPAPYSPGSVGVNRGHYRLDPTGVAGGVGWSLTDVRQVPLPPSRQAGNREITSSTSGDQALLTTPTPASLGYTGTLQGVLLAASFRQSSGANPQIFEVQSPAVGNLTQGRFEANGSIEAIGFPRPGGTAGWLDSESLTFGIQKSADASAAKIAALALEIESPTVVLSPAFAVGAPSGAVTMMSGEYTGNSTFQTVSLGFRPDWVFIAPVGTGLAGVLWWDSMLSPHGWTQQANMADRFRREAAGFSVMGAASECNTNATVYRYVALVDQTKRALYRGAFAFKTAEAGPRAIGNLAPFAVPVSFTPTLLWCHVEQFDNTSANGGLIKGPGHTSTNSSPLDATQITTGITSIIGPAFSVGSYLTNLPQTAWTGWGVTGWTTYRIWNTATYTGNGAGSQAVAVDLGGRTAGWVLVVPHNGASYVRHQSHTGSNSSQIGGSNSTTGITSVAVADQITVGSSLNTNGVVYEVLVIVVGDAAGGFPPGTTSFSDPAPPLEGVCVVDFGVGVDSGGGSGCSATLSSGADTGGGSGCGVSL